MLAREGPTSELRPQLVVSSPLTRTLTTAKLCVRCGDGEGTAPLVALEHVRETVNYLCDGRRTLSQIGADVSGVDFSFCTSDHDAIWQYYEQQYGPQDAFDKLRETADMPALHQRAQAAVDWLAKRPEKEIVVVSHAAFLRHLFGFGHEKGNLGAFSPCLEYEDVHVAGFMRAYFGNAEMRSVVAAFPPSAESAATS